MEPLRPSSPSLSRLSPPTTTEGGRYSPTKSIAARMGNDGTGNGLAALSPNDGTDAPVAPAKASTGPKKWAIGLGIALIVAALAYTTSGQPSPSPVPTPATQPVAVHAQPQAIPQAQVAAQAQATPVLDHVAYAKDHGYRVAGQVETESGATSNDGDSAMWGIAGAAIRFRTDGQRITSDGQGLEANSTYGAGTLVCQILRADSAATAVGLRVGDVLLTYDGVPMQSIAAVNAVHVAKKPLQAATLTVMRAGATLTLTGPLGFGSRTGALQ